MERVKVFMEGIHWLFQGFYSISRSPNDVMDSFQVLQGTLSSNLWSISRIGSPALSGDSLAGCLLDLYWYFFFTGFWLGSTGSLFLETYLNGSYWLLCGWLFSGWPFHIETFQWLYGLVWGLREVLLHFNDFMVEFGGLGRRGWPTATHPRII